MLTLSDILNITLPYRTVAEDTYITYKISDGTRDIFVGRFFAQAGTSSIEICLNDIVASQFSNDNILEKYMQYIDVNTEAKRKIKTFSASVYQGMWLSAGSITVYMGYEYPFKDYYLEDPNTRSSNIIYPALVGLNYTSEKPIQTQSLDLYPHYPNMKCGLVLGQRLVRNDIYKNTPSTSIVTLDKDGNVNGSLWSQQLTGYDTTYIANYMGQLSMRTDATDIAITNHNITATKVSGKKLWRVELDGQYLYEDHEVWDFLSDFDYPGQFYSENFYIQDNSSEIIPFIVETNDPQADIQDVFDGYPHLRTRCQMRYIEIEYASNSILSYDPASSGPISMDQYSSFNKFMSRLSGGYITSALVIRWGILPGREMPDPVQLTFPFIVPDIRQLEVWQTYFEEFQDKDTFTYEDFFAYNTGERGQIYGKHTTYVEEEIDVPIVLAKIDQCPAKFYVQWIDRLGGVQCQPFDGKDMKTIDYTAISITNNLGKKRPISYSETFTFELNTRYISDKEMPCYEGLFVSPFIKLLDTENNKVYNVLSATNKYQEKTYNNQGKHMYNLTVQLTCDRNENIIY